MSDNSSSESDSSSSLGFGVFVPNNNNNPVDNEETNNANGGDAEKNLDMTFKILSSNLSAPSSPDSIPSDSEFDGFKVVTRNEELELGLGTSLSRTFQWEHRNDIKHVAIAGTFTGWKPMLLHYYKNINLWRIIVTFDTKERGVYMYKTIVNDEWSVDSRALTCRDAHGNVNNVIEVLGKSVHEHELYDKCTTEIKVYGEDCYVVCDACKRINLQTFYHCLECGNFDFCESCYPLRKASPFLSSTSPAHIAQWVAATLARQCLKKHWLSPDPKQFETMLQDIIGILKQNGETTWTNIIQTQLTQCPVQAYPHQRATFMVGLLNTFFSAIQKDVEWS
jgi:hypothetical protein